ncbi:MAG: HD-GYP domain-containing protein, partial [Solirubrobacteraceae bacterium]|nr:HD-GYP domain-containing protein [Patulibacter sp.]
ARVRASGRSVAPRRGPLVVAAATVVDVALAILGLEVAITADAGRWTLALMLPFMLLLAHFAREREHRLTHALELSAAYRGTAALMADVLEADDEYTGGEHTRGVVELSLQTGEALGLDVAAMRVLEFGALLHDIGKLRVPNEVINKPGRLTAREWEIIRRHPEIGEAMLLRVGGVLAEVAPVVRGHHERFDGTGYPDGLVGDAIPIEARIITVCDSFSAMTTTRSYRTAMSHHEAIAELHRCTPGQFDPSVVAALVGLLGTELEGGDGLHVAAPVLRPFETRVRDADLPADGTGEVTAIDVA